MNEHEKSTAKEDYLTPHSLHVRLRIIEVVLVISLVLNLVHWFVAGANDKKIENQVDNISQQTGVPK